MAAMDEKFVGSFCSTVFAQAREGDLSFINKLRTLSIHRPETVWKILTFTDEKQSTLLHIISENYKKGQMHNLKGYRSILDAILLLADRCHLHGAKVLLEKKNSSGFTAVDIPCSNIASEKQRKLEIARKERFLQFRAGHDEDAGRFWRKTFGDALSVPRKVFVVQLLRCLQDNYNQKWNEAAVTYALYFLLEYSVELSSTITSNVIVKDEKKFGVHRARQWDGISSFCLRPFPEEGEATEILKGYFMFKFSRKNEKVLVPMYKMKNEKKVQSGFRLNLQEYYFPDKIPPKPVTPGSLAKKDSEYDPLDTWVLPVTHLIHALKVFYKSQRKENHVKHKVVGIQLISVDPNNLDKETESPVIGYNDADGEKIECRTLMAPAGTWIQYIDLYYEKYQTEGSSDQKSHQWMEETPAVSCVVGRCRSRFAQNHFVGRHISGTPRGVDLNMPALKSAIQRCRETGKEMKESVRSLNGTEIQVHFSAQEELSDTGPHELRGIEVKFNVKSIPEEGPDSVLIGHDAKEGGSTLANFHGPKMRTSADLLSFLDTQESQRTLYAALHKGQKDLPAIREISSTSELIEALFDVTKRRDAVRIQRTLINEGETCVAKKSEEESYQILAEILRKEDLGLTEGGRIIRVDADKQEMEIMLDQNRQEEQPEERMALPSIDDEEEDAATVTVGINQLKTSFRMTRNDTFAQLRTLIYYGEGSHNVTTANLTMMSVGQFTFLMRVFGPFKNALENIMTSTMSVDKRVQPWHLINADRRIPVENISRAEIIRQLTTRQIGPTFTYAVPQWENTMLNRYGIMTHRNPFQGNNGWPDGSTVSSFRAWTGQLFDEFKVYGHNDWVISSIYPSVLPGSTPPRKEQLQILNKPCTFSRPDHNDGGSRLGPYQTLFHAVQDWRKQVEERVSEPQNKALSSLTPLQKCIFTGNSSSRAEVKRGMSRIIEFIPYHGSAWDALSSVGIKSNAYEMYVSATEMEKQKMDTESQLKPEDRRSRRIRQIGMSKLVRRYPAITPMISSRASQQYIRQIPFSEECSQDGYVRIRDTLSASEMNDVSIGRLNSLQQAKERADSMYQSVFSEDIKNPARK